MIRKKIADALCSKAVDQHDIVCAVISLSKIVETAKKLQHDLFRTVTEHEERIRRLERSSEKNDTSEIIKFQMSILEKMNTIEKMINVAFPVENQTFEIENGDPY